MFWRPWFRHFHVQSPCNPLIEDYTEIFYMIIEWDVPTVQCMMGFGGPNLMRKANGLDFSSQSQSQSQSYVTTNGESATRFLVSRPDFYYCQTVAGLLMWGACSDEGTGLSFTIAGTPRQRSHFRVRVPRDSWPYFTVSALGLPEPGGPLSRGLVRILSHHLLEGTEEHREKSLSR
jgi:hypothetical protein